MILSICYQNVAIGVDGDALQTLEFRVTGTPSTEAPDEGTLGAEDLDTVISTVGHEDVPLIVHGNSPATSGTYVTLMVNEKENHFPSVRSNTLGT